MFSCLPVALSLFHSLVFPHPSLQTASLRSVNILGAPTSLQCEAHSVNSICRSHPRHPASGVPQDERKHKGGGTTSDTCSEKNKIQKNSRSYFKIKTQLSRKKSQNQAVSIKNTVKKSISVKSWCFQFMYGLFVCLGWGSYLYIFYLVKAAASSASPFSEHNPHAGDRSVTCSRLDRLILLTYNNTAVISGAVPHCLFSLFTMDRHHFESAGAATRFISAAPFALVFSNSSQWV